LVLAQVENPLSFDTLFWSVFLADRMSALLSTAASYSLKQCKVSSLEWSEVKVIEMDAFLLLLLALHST